jgi:hypothetical protein
VVNILIIIVKIKQASQQSKQATCNSKYMKVHPSKQATCNSKLASKLQAKQGSHTCEDISGIFAHYCHCLAIYDLSPVWENTHGLPINSEAWTLSVPALQKASSGWTDVLLTLCTANAVACIKGLTLLQLHGEQCPPRTVRVRGGRL